MVAESEGRVLVVGVSPQEIRRTVRELEALDVEVTACTEPDRVASLHDARSFDVVAFGRATLGPGADAQRAALRAQNPALRTVDVIGPLAVRQVLAALQHDPSVARFVRDLDVEVAGGRGIARAEVLERCQLELWMFRLANGALASETLALVDAAPGIFTFVIAADVMAGAHSVVLEANGEELLHFAFLAAPARG